jgi:hypothetical protein
MQLIRRESGRLSCFLFIIAVAFEGGELLHQAKSVGHILTGKSHKLFCFFGMGLFERAIAVLAVSILLKIERWGKRIELKRIFALVFEVSKSGYS